VGQKEKLIERLKRLPRDFTWQELTTLLKSLDYAEAKQGKTGGSRRRFVHESKPPITLHKPHPSSIVKFYAVKEVLKFLEEEELI
jgi:hypothetical protein